MIKKILPTIIRTSLFVCLAFMTMTACGQTFNTLTSIPGTNQDFDGGIAFELNGTIYAGGGFYGKKLYAYDISLNTWSLKNDLPASVYSRTSAQVFKVNGKVYLLNGDDINPTNFTSTKLLDFYEYNPSTDSWAPKPAPPFTYRRGAGVFVINNKAYLVGGYDNTNTNTNTTWEYDGNNWSQRASFPTPNIAQPSTFVLNDKGYVACGLTKVTTTMQTNLLYEYNPTTDTWTAKAQFPGAVRGGAMGFSAGGKGFCGLGSNVNSSFQFVYHTDFYSYDPATNSWSLVSTSFPGASRQSALTVSYNNKAYIGAGWSFIGGNNAYYRDWYEFEFSAPNALHDVELDQNLFYPNPTSGMLYMSEQYAQYIQNRKIEIYDISGRKIIETKLSSNNTVDASSLKPGNYFLKLKSSHRYLQFVKQ